MFQEKKGQNCKAKCREDSVTQSRGAMRESLTDFPELCRPREHGLAAKTAPAHRKKTEFLA